MGSLEEILTKYPGNDNYKRPKADYIKKVFAMTDEELRKECDQMIWLSAYANNNPRSDYHWQCDVCYDVARTRDEKASIYVESHEALTRSVRGY